MASIPKEQTINLQIGDIIEINAPSDERLNEKQFLIKYIDKSRIDVLGRDGNTISIDINDDGSLRNESITSIAVLSRAETPSYARQNKLIPDQWIDIYFGGDVPTVMTGKITSLDEDQIEIKLVDDEVIYIDFAYKGIPDDIPIEKFILRDAPVGDEKVPTPPDIKDPAVLTPALTEDTEDAEDVEQGELEEDLERPSPEPVFRERVRNVILAADQIQFGDKLGKVAMLVQVPEEERRYGIEKQTTDMLNELLSDIPNAQRTQGVLNNIHRMIERYKQLRTEFSKFDQNGNALMPDIQGADFKPLVESLENLNQKLYWILPVVRNVKKLYDIDEDVSRVYDDVSPETLAAVRTAETDVMQAFKEGRIPDGQNGYDYMIRKMQQYWTPFNPPGNPTASIANKIVQTNITTVVDNLQNFYSSVAKNDDIRRKRFLIQEYNLGMNTLEAQRIRGGDTVIKVKSVTEPDTASVKSFLTLPESAVTFSHVNLPSTDILMKCNLSQNHLSYWRALNKLTNVTVQPITADPVEFDETTYLQDIREYLPNEDSDITYEDYLKKIVPKTRVLFALVNKHIKGKLTMHAVLTYLEPFLVYQKDLSFKQYQEIVGFISEKINLWKKDYVVRRRDFENLLSGQQIPAGSNTILSLFKAQPEVEEQIKQSYYLDKIPLDDYTTSEIMVLMNSLDYSRFFNNSVATENNTLKLPDDSVEALQAEDLLQAKIDAAKATDAQQNCETRVLSKKYLAMDELQADNGKTIYFDKQYDQTPYMIYEDVYKKEIEKLAAENDWLSYEKIGWLSDKLEKTNGVSKKNAMRDAEAMINGKREVEPGDYAVLILEEREMNPVLYYKRRDNTWERDTSIEPTEQADMSSIFCNTAEKCISVGDNCDSIGKAALDIQKIAMQQMTKEFVDNLEEGAQQIEAKLRTLTEITKARLPALKRMAEQSALKDDIEKYKLGGEALEVMENKSPASDILDLILSQSDFVKRQNDISRFVTQFTRPALPVESESQWWLYCIQTGVQLLPTFVYKLANAFIVGENYFMVLQRIAAEQGVLGEDGEAIIDKYTGRVITKIDFSADEGFDASGFAVKTRDMMEAELGTALAQAPKEEIEEFSDPETEKIARVMRALSRYMGLDTSVLEDFVISETAKLLSKSMPARADYERALAAASEKKRKKLDPYDIVYDQTLILLTMSFLLIGIQTVVPSLRTRKTYPGCIKSFSGYPSFGDADKSGIEYIACIANNIKSSIEPWNSLQKLSEKKIVSKMEGLIGKFILPMTVIQERIATKQDYNALNQEEIIPETHDITNWINFLPPLKPVSVNVSPPTKEFQEQFLQELRRGSKAQLNKIDALRSKLIYLALSIEENIQKIVTKNVSENSAVLSNNARVPYLENACCNDGDDDTFNYFASKAPQIVVENNIVKDLRAVLDDVGRMSKAPILFDPSDTRLIYPEIAPEFTEETIYKAFITYCKYNSDIPISEELRAVCMDKPDQFDISASIEEKIRQLRRDGKNFDETSLANLMSIINRKNLVRLSLRTITISNIQKIRDRLTALQDIEQVTFPESFIKNMLDVMDRFGSEDFSLDKDSEQVRTMKNYLATVNDQMTGVVSDFVRRNFSKQHATFLDCIQTITDFRPDGGSQDMFKMCEFMKNSIWLFARVFPNIVINQVKYDNIKVPSCWNLSEIHQRDIKNQAADHYKPLVPFYNDDCLANFLTLFQQENRDIWLTAWDTMYLAPVTLEDGELSSIFDERMTRLLFKFYMLDLMMQMIELTDREELYQQQADRPCNPLLRPQEVDVAMVGDQFPMLEIMSGAKKEMSEKVAKVITGFMTIVCGTKKVIDLNYEDLMDKVTRSKEKEKDMIVQFLTDLSDEEREIENLFKNHRIGQWSVGMQKGFRVYQGDTYDKEREDIEKRTIIEKRLKQVDGVTEGLMDMFAMEAIMEGDEAAMIEAEAFGIEYNGEDNNIGDEDFDDEL